MHVSCCREKYFLVLENSELTKIDSNKDVLAVASCPHMTLDGYINVV